MLRNVVLAAIRHSDALSEWANRPRVRLMPFYYDKRAGDYDAIKNYRTHIKEQNLETFPRYKVEDTFYEVIKQEPIFCVVLQRYLAGYFKAQHEGIEDPKSDIVAMWEVKEKGSHIQKVYIFYVDDTYYAGDVVHDNRPQWVLPSTIKYREKDHTFYIRLLYKVKESVNPDGTGPREPKSD